MFSSIRTRLWLTYILVVLVMLFIATAAAGVFLLRNPVQDRRELQRLRIVSGLVAQRGQLFDVNANFESSRLQTALKRADRLSEARLAIYSPDGKLVADSRSDSASPLPEWAYLENRRPGVGSILRDAANRQWLFVTTSLEGGGKLLVASPRQPFRIAAILRDEFLSPFLRGAILALGLTILLSVWIASWISAPLKRLTFAAHQVSQGDFQPVPLEGPSELKTMAHSFNEMAEKVKTSQRSQRDLLANVSHDLKTPLTSIQGYAQAILDGTIEKPDDSRNAAQVIYDEAGRMNRMVLELLDLARMQAGTVEFDFQWIDLYSLIIDVVEKFRPLANQSEVDLQVGFMPNRDSLPRILVDKDRITQVISNLIDNALKFTPKGGQIAIQSSANDGWMEVQIIDTGPGISPGELDRIFERFYQTDKSRSRGSSQGSGLGLAIAREIIYAHGGTISAHNRNEIATHNTGFPPLLASQTGSLFLIRLPLIPSARVENVPHRSSNPDQVD